MATISIWLCISFSFAVLCGETRYTLSSPLSSVVDIVRPGSVAIVGSEEKRENEKKHNHFTFGNVLPIVIHKSKSIPHMHRVYLSNLVL